MRQVLHKVSSFVRLHGQDKKKQKGKVMARTAMKMSKGGSSGDIVTARRTLVARIRGEYAAEGVRLTIKKLIELLANSGEIGGCRPKDGKPWSHHAINMDIEWLERQATESSIDSVLEMRKTILFRLEKLYHEVRILADAEFHKATEIDRYTIGYDKASSRLIDVISKQMLASGVLGLSSVSRQGSKKENAIKEVTSIVEDIFREAGIDADGLNKIEETISRRVGESDVN